MATTKAITIEQLYLECAKQIKAGRGKRRILLSGDDEGNSYHEMFYGFTACKEFNFSDPCMGCCLPYGVTPEQADKEYIVLG